MNEKVKELLIGLENKVTNFSDEDFKNILKSYSRKLYHRYSLNNLLIASLTLADRTNTNFMDILTGMELAPFKIWNERGHTVKKGEKALMILTPMTMKKKDSDGEVVLDKDGNEKSFTFFGLKPVFDISQTEKKYDSKDNEWRKVTNCDISFTEVLKKVKTQFSVKQRNMKQELGGFITGKEITLNSSKSEHHRLSTLFHELGHYYCEHTDKRQDVLPAIREVEAEATAYCLCKFLGFDINSEFYIKSFNKDGKEILKCLTTVNKAVNNILKLLDVK